MAPNKSDANVLVADIMIQLQMFAQAQPYLAKALQQCPDSAALSFKYGLVMLVLGQDYHAYFAKARKLDEQYFNDHRQQLDDIIRFLNAQHKE